MPLPADFVDPRLAGQLAQVELTVTDAQESRVPALDEAFLLSAGIHEGGMIALRNAVLDNLQHQRDAAIRARTKSDVMRQLSAAHSDIEVPKGLVDNELQALIAHAGTNAQDAGEKAPSSHSSLASEAQVRVRAFILLAEIARQNEIAPDQNRINTTLAQIASEYDEPQRVVELYAADSDLMVSLRNRVIEDQAIEWVIAHANVTPRRMAFAELVPVHSPISDALAEPAVG